PAIADPPIAGQIYPSWWTTFRGLFHDGLDPDFTSTRYEKGNGVVELTGLATSDLVQIVRQVGGQHVCAERYSDEDIQGLMQKVDQSGRPLYAHLLGDSLRDGGSNPVTKDELLTQTLNRERQTRWRQRFRSEPPKLGIDQTCQKLAILASMLGGYDISSSLWPKEFGELTQTACEEALALVDAPVGDGIQPISAIPPMQPDLLREWFVLSSLAIKHHDFDQLTQFAWSANNEAMAAFLSRCVQDFFDHPVIQKLVEGVPNDCSWIIHDLGFKCHPISVGLPSGLRFETIIDGEITYSFDGFDPDSESTVVSADEAQKAAFWYSIAAKLDYAPSIHNLAYLCWTGQGVERNQRQAFDLYVKAAELGHPESMEIVADFLEFGVWGEPDIRNAATLYEGAARQGQPEAAYRLGLLLLKGTGIDQDIQRALELFEQASSVGHSKAKIQLGLLHLNGVGVPENREKAFQLVCEAAQLGSTWAMRELGVLYQNGFGTSPNPRRGTALIRLAAIQGFQTAELDLGICYRDGIGVKQNLRRAHWYFDLCDRFVNRRLAGEALVLSAAMFEQGVGFVDEPDFRQAFNRRYRAARAGNQFARQTTGIHDFSDRSYGRFDRKGYGRYYDDEPFVLLRRCAAQGNPQAMYTVGQLYSHGIFFRKNDVAAFAWYLLSGKRGSLDGQYALSRCLHMGIGSPVHKFSALIWALFAANGGHSEAIRFVQSRKKEAPISYYLAASGVRSLRMASKLVRKFVVSS
ncbi:SEL1-like repeat protein, partial [Mesobacterium sp. TK19101]